jgi:hypothetical protein
VGHFRQAYKSQISSTSVEMSHTSQRDGRRVASSLSEAGIPLHPSDVPSTPKSSCKLSPSQTPLSSQRANIGIRRARQTSVLLGSPARPSHATRMRQVFEDASLEDALSHPNHGVGIYPQLPNISRTCSLVRRTPASRPSTPARSRLGSPILSVQFNESLSDAPPKIGLLLQASTRSSSLSDSWSGDSDYLITKPPPPVPSPPAFSLPIKEWLDTVTPEDSFIQESSSTTSAQTLLDMEVSRLGQKKTLSPGSKKNKNRPALPALLGDSDSSLQGSSISVSFCPVNDNFNSSLPCSNGPDSPSSPLRDTTNQRKSMPMNSPTALQETDDGGVELSFLSPDVCTERGPARYRSRQDRRSPLGVTNPFKGEAARFQIRHTCSDNKILDTADETIRQTENPLRILGNTPKRTRFWRPAVVQSDTGDVPSNEK